MKTLPQHPLTASRLLKTLLALSALLLAPLPPARAQVSSRITSSIRDSARATLQNSHSPRANAQNDLGALNPGTQLQGITIVFSRSAAQQAALDTLVAAQQNPSSPLYHQWLTPDQFAASFGMSDADLAAVTNWLQGEGFTVLGPNRSRTALSFSGTAAQVASAFGAELHNYKINGQTVFAPSADLSVPAALSGVVLAVRNLSSFRPRPHVIFKPGALASGTTAPAAGVKPNFTSGQSGNHYMTPMDVATIYDINAAYTAGYTGTGQSIAVIGQSAVALTDISNFQTAAGVPPNLPTTVLVPNSGASTIYASDEAESDLDLEYSSSIGRAASIFFVYTGNGSNYNVINAAEYAIENRVASIITLSYGDCEYDTGQAEITSLNTYLEQASAQGQTVINSAGDSGSSACYGDTNLTTTQQEQLNVNFPASSQYVTGLGGTEFPAADVAAGSTTYWTSNGMLDVIGSALSYIPETVWNDDSATDGLSSGGGGTSTFIARPSWQTGVTGIPSGSYRLVPDISLDSSPNDAGYLYCSSAGESTTGVTGSCANGFRDSSDLYLTVAGGTSFAAPIFAGMLSLIEQKVGGAGLGLINPTLYSLAANPTTYSTAFHDITTGNNECLAGTGYCSGTAETEYAAGVGYDEATGLGSIDLFNLLTAWPASSGGGGSTLLATTTTLAPATTSPASGASDAIVISVASNTSTSTAITGTVSVTVDGTVVNSSLALSNGVATYTFSSTTSGAHTISATYSGTSTFAASTGTVAVNVAAVGTFSLAATNVTIAAGGSGASTVTVTPSGGYNGTVTFSSNTTIANACETVNNVTVSGTSNAPVSTSLTIYTSATTCDSLARRGVPGFRRLGPSVSAANRMPGAPANLPASTRMPLLLSGVALAAAVGRKRRNLRLFASLLVLGTIGFALTGCSDHGAAAANPTNSAQGSYTFTLTGADSVNSNITASTTFTVTVN
jgi:subtilase family serine protease